MVDKPTPWRSKNDLYETVRERCAVEKREATIRYSYRLRNYYLFSDAMERWKDSERNQKNVFITWNHDGNSELRQEVRPI